MKKAYIYPNSTKKKEVSNPYMKDFINSLSGYFVFVNREKPSASGIFDLRKYISRIDFIFLNWIEDLPDKKYGVFQSIFFLITIYVMKLKKIRIFYVLHNKESHYATHSFLKRKIKKAVLKNADYVVCHSSEGLKLNGFGKKNIKYIPHPFQGYFKGNDALKEYDILIWGSIRPYKGIDSYLSYLESKNYLNRYKTLIVGKIFPPEYEQELMKYRSEKIRIENKYIDDSVLNELIAKSGIILFTYNEKSVLSSGALVYSLSRGALVIGPDTGSFHDLKTEGIIDVFENYDELISRIEYHLNHPNLNTRKIEEFVKHNSWQSFGKEIGSWLKV